MKQEICKRITFIRNNLGMNKHQFASFLGITPQYLGSVESGENCLSVEKIILLSQKTNISTDFILLGKEDLLNEKMLKHILDISDEQLESCFSLLRGMIELLRIAN